MKLQEYKHKVPVQVRFNDVDRVGHVNNACYHTYIELGRVKYFDEVLKRDVNWNERGFVLARTEIDHVQPIYLGDEVICFTKAVKIGSKSLHLESCVAKAGPDGLVVCALAKGVLVSMDYTKNISIPMPEDWKNLFSVYEGRDLT
jgi:acyl-CoA thioester hydrolase